MSVLTNPGTNISWGMLLKIPESMFFVRGRDIPKHVLC